MQKPFLFSLQEVSTQQVEVKWVVCGCQSQQRICKPKHMVKTVIANPDSSYDLSWSSDVKYKVPFRCWLSLEYDLRTNLKFVGSAWIDNGYKTTKLSQTIGDYLGTDGTPAFSLTRHGVKQA